MVSNILKLIAFVAMLYCAAGVVYAYATENLLFLVLMGIGFLANQAVISSKD